MRLNDTLTGLLLLGFGLVVVLYARTFPATPGSSIGPGLFPIVIGLGIAACGAVLMWSGRKQTFLRWFEFEAWMRQPRMALNAALLIGTLIFYALAVGGG
jgi:putative tricarboxylic transport membrane protein